MALIMMDGFDKYGPINSNGASVAALMSGEWTSVAANNQIVAGLTAVGYALYLPVLPTLAKTLSANYPRLIGGIRFSSPLAAQGFIQFRDGGTGQCTLCIEVTGIINLRTGTTAGTILNSGGLFSADTVHYLEWDITFAASGAYSVWLDSVLIFSGTGNTRGGTTNNYANGFTIGGGSNVNFTIDDLYLFDNTGSINNAVLLTMPRIETSFPIADSAVQFAFGAGILGSNIQRSTFTLSAANTLRVRAVTPPFNCTINSIAFLPGVTLGSIVFRPVIYSDSAGVPGTLLSTGSTVTGMTANTAVVMPLTTPQSLTAGTQYWIGYMNDVVTGASGLAALDGTATDRTAGSTFSSGAPSTAPAVTPATSTVLWGNIANPGVNWYETSRQPPGGISSYVFDGAIGHEDLYSFPAISTPPTAGPPTVVYAAAVKAHVSNSTSGSRSVSVRMKSGATDSAGSLGTTPIFPSFSWFISNFPIDPATGAAWTISGFNAATSGLRLDA